MKGGVSSLFNALEFFLRLEGPFSGPAGCPVKSVEKL